MGSTVCNATSEHEKIVEEDLWDGGITFHQLSLIMGGVCTLLACTVSIFLIMHHAMHYSKPIEQRHIIRILFIVPVYSVVAWLSMLFYNESVYFEVIGNCYEAFCIAAFFSLICHYIAPDLHNQKDYFRGIAPKAWLWPLTWFQRWKCCGANRGGWRNPRSGLTWFNIVWAGVFQYCVIRVLMTIVAVATQSAGKYCEESLSPAFAHFWTLVIESLSVTIAMYCLIQFYYQINRDIAQYSPFLKILSVKLVIFLSFWQSTLIGLLMSTGAISATKKLATADLKYGLPELLINMEMLVFSILHLWAFSWKSYATASPDGRVTDLYGNGKASYEGGRWGLQALADAMNPLDLLKAIGRSVRWLIVGRRNRTRDPSYQQHETIGLQPPESEVITDVRSTASPSSAAMSGGRNGRYGGDEEAEVLLANAQSNPSTSQLGTSPWDRDNTDYLHWQPNRLYGQHGSSPSNNSEHKSTGNRPCGVAQGSIVAQ